MTHSIRYVIAIVMVTLTFSSTKAADIVDTAGLMQAITSVLDNIGVTEGYFDENKWLPTPIEYEVQLSGIVAVQLPAPWWHGRESQLGNTEMEQFADEKLRPKLADYFAQNPGVAKQLIHNAKSRLVRPS